MLKAKDLKDQSLEELQFECEQRRHELFVHKNSNSKSELAKVSHIAKHLRKDIARLLTFIGQKQAERNTQQGQG